MNRFSKFDLQKILRSVRLVLTILVLFGWAYDLDAQVDDSRPSTKLEYSKWSGDVNVPDPVAIAFDDFGRAFVTQTQRRKIQDLDIREHRDWIPSDLSLQSVNDKLEFYRKTLPSDPNQSDANSKHVGDHNGDGQHDYHDLTAISEIIHLVEDTDGDGTADSTKIFADHFQTEVTGIAAGVLHHKGSVYATVAPDVWKLKDKDGDGEADSREVFATGFGIHIAYAGHDMHGLTVGPDGKIYWSIGDKGISTVSGLGKRSHYPNQGGVLRCNPDGSEFEVFAHGLRNVQELAFDQYGNLFGFDNDSDQPNEQERFIEIVHGSDAGWRCNYQYRDKDYNPWMAERIWEPQNDSQPLHIIPPIANTVNGPCGFAFNPGTALSPDYKNYFFLTSTLGGEQLSFKIVPNVDSEKGDSFELANQHQIGQGIPMIGINFGPDGGLYGVDWSGGYPLNQKGAIWKIDAPESASSAPRIQTASNLRLDYGRESVDSLLRLLAAPDQRVRLKAQFELVRRKSFLELKAVALDPTDSNSELDAELKMLKRIHAIWGIGQIARRNNDAMVGNAIMRSITQPLVDDRSPEIRLQIARTVGDVGLSDLRPIIRLLKDENSRVRVQTALAFSNSSTPGAFEAVVEAAEELKPKQTYLRHAYAFALAELESDRVHHLMVGSKLNIFSPERLEQLVKHESDSVRACAIIALRKFSKHEEYNDRLVYHLKPFLNDVNRKIAEEAARAIHDDFSIPTAMPDLAETLNSTNVSSEAFIRRAINANYRLGSNDCLKRVADFAANDANPNELRVVALDAIATWSVADALDKVTGRYRGAPSKREIESSLCRASLLSALGSESNKVKLATVQAFRGLKMEIPVDSLLAIYESKLPADIRAEALESICFQKIGISGKNVGQVEQDANNSALPLHQKRDLKAARRKLLEDTNLKNSILKLLSDSIESKHEKIRLKGVKLLAMVLPELAAKTVEMNVFERATSTLLEKQRATLLLAEVDLSSLDEGSEVVAAGRRNADRLIILQLISLMEGKLDPTLALETIEAAKRLSGDNEKLKKLVDELEEQRTKIAKALVADSSITKSIETHFECLSGGDAAIGKEVFNTHIEAQCSRCHRVGAKGSTVGPNLKGVASRKPATKDSGYLLRSIVAPSDHIVEKYQTIMLLLDTGETAQGVLVSRNETETVLADSTGKEIFFENDWIEEETIQKTSIMPIAKTLTKREIRDLVAYLGTLKSIPKKTKK